MTKMKFLANIEHESFMLLPGVNSNQQHRSSERFAEAAPMQTSSMLIETNNILPDSPAIIEHESQVVSQSASSEKGLAERMMYLERSIRQRQEEAKHIQEKISDKEGQLAQLRACKSATPGSLGMRCRMLHQKVHYIDRKSTPRTRY